MIKKHKRRGFTLIETVMSIVLVAIISVVAAAFIAQAFNSWAFTSQQKSMDSATRNALYRMVREIKTVNKATNILVWTAGTFSFRDPANNTITYSQTGTNLMRGTDVLADNLASPGGLTFSYLNGAGAVPASSDAISVVQVRLLTVKGTNRYSTGSAARIRLK